MIPRGRPTLYKPENADLARKFCMLGATNDDLAGCFEVSPRTIDDWIATNPEFAAGVKQGRDIADASIVEKLYARAMGCSVKTEKVFLFQGEPVRVEHTMNYPPDTNACMFWLRNRRPRQWLEKARPAQDEGPTISELEAASERVRLAALAEHHDK